MRPVATLFSVAFLACTPLIADELPDIQAALEASKKEFATDVKSATDELVAAFDAEILRTQNKTRVNVAQQIKALDQLNAQRLAFMSDYTVTPTVPSLRSSSRTYSSAIKKATQRCQKAFDQAAKQCQRAKEFDEAKKILESKSLYIQETLKHWYIKPGMVFAGRKIWTKVGAVRPVGHKEPWTFEIKTVDPPKFTGHVKCAVSVPVTGTIRDNYITFSGDRLGTYKAYIVGDRLDGVSGNGKLQLKLKPPAE